MRHGWLALLLVTMALAGCAGDKAVEQAPDEDDPGEVVEIEPGIKVAENRAVLRGQVINDAGQSVPGARVSLVGTSFFSETPDNGRFRFINVTPGEHTLRVEKPGFQVAEKELTLERSNLTTVEVILLPDGATGAGYRAHTHDYWGGNERLTVMDQTVELMPAGGGPLGVYTQARHMVLYPNLGGTNGYWWDFYLPAEIPEGNPGVAADQPALIYPGTKQVEVTLTWDADDLTVDSLNLGYEGAKGGDRVWIEGIASGEPAVITIEDNETTDDGHQSYSFWEFVLQADNTVMDPAAYQPGAALGEVHIRVEVIFGELPLEPEHPKFWESRSQIQVRDGDRAMKWPFAITEYDRSEEMRGSMGATESIVPPGTTRMRIEFSWEYERGGDQTDVDDWSLWFRTPDQHPRYTTWDELRVIEPVEVDVPGQTKVYEFDVPKEWTDAFYQHSSLWRFFPVREDPDGFEEYTFQAWRGTDESFYAEAWVFNDDA